METATRERIGHMPLLKDPTSQTVLCHVNLILRHVLPEWYMQGYMKRSREGVLAALKLISPDKTGVLVGSFVDGFTIPDVKLRDIAGDKMAEYGQRYDLDMLMMSQLTAGYKRGKCDGIIDIAETYPGYFRVNSDHPEETSQNVDSRGAFSLFRDIEDDIGTPHEIHGPAVMITTSGIGFDMVPTGRCSRWPDQALPWVYRTSLTGWPSWKTKQDIIRNKCYFVQKAHSSSKDPTSEFRFSFVMGEKLLISEMSVSQKQCFVIFKTLVKYVVSSDSHISSYCLKTTLFWTLEKIPKSVWEDKIHGTALCFLQLLDTLIHFLCEHNIPQYFIPENNLISHVDHSELQQDIHRLLYLRRRPVETALEYDNTYCLPTTIHGFMDEIPKIIRRTTANYKISNCKQETVEDCLKLHHEDALDCFSHMVKIKSISGAIETLHDMRFYELLFGLYEMNKVKFVHDHMHEHKRMLSINRMEFLSILCSVVFLQEPTTVPNAQQSDLVDACFETVMQLPESVSCQFMLHFIMYLLHCEKEQVAYFILQTVEEIFIQAEQSCDFEYQRECVNILDDVLSLLYKENPMVKFPCRVLYYYLFVHVCVKLDIMEVALEKMFTLEALRPEELSDPMDYSSILVGFAHMHLNNFWDAAEAFEDDVCQRQELYTRAGVEEEISSSLLQIDSGSRALICRCMALYDHFLCLE